jgi:transcriptional regulator with XRE-family HTH domain
MKTIEEVIGTNLKYFRYKSGLSQEKFYSSLGLNPKYYASIERGEVNVSVEFLDQLSKLLNVDIREFFNRESNRIINKKRIDERENKD